MKEISVYWFRQDLRQLDNIALFEAGKEENVIIVFSLFDYAPDEFALGKNSKLWLYHSLKSLNKSLNNKINFSSKNIIDIINELSKKFLIKKIFMNKCFEDYNINIVDKLKKSCEETKIEVIEKNSCYIWEPGDIKKNDGTFFKVYTPFKNHVYQKNVRKVVSRPKFNNLIKYNELKLENLFSYKDDIANWEIGEDAALKKFDNFIKNGLSNYKIGRDFPASNHTSRLSPNMHWGEISPVYIWHKVKELNLMKSDLDHFISEVVWREFSVYLLFHVPNFHTENFKKEYDKFLWKKDMQLFEKWRDGITGIPIVDAGMRQLKKEGYIHNRVRMIVASFLVKNLMIHWHLGRDIFWEYLFDADLGSNSFGWQWVAGSGADAAPYFRIFNPVLQGKKFDPKGEYTRKFVPELKNVPDQYLFSPWEWNGVVKNYPKPIVCLSESRKEALRAYDMIRAK